MTTYFINKFNLLNTLKFPEQRYSSKKEYKFYICGDREWIIAGDRNVFHNYKNHTEKNPTKRFGSLYVDTEDVNDYYREYPYNCFVDFNLK